MFSLRSFTHNYRCPSHAVRFKNYNLVVLTTKYCICDISVTDKYVLKHSLRKKIQQNSTSFKNIYLKILKINFSFYTIFKSKGREILRIFLPI
jgi:hypothetical protein